MPQKGVKHPRNQNQVKHEHNTRETVNFARAERSKKSARLYCQRLPNEHEMKKLAITSVIL